MACFPRPPGGDQSTYEAPWGGPDRQTAFIFLVCRVEHQNEPNRPQTRSTANTGDDYYLRHAFGLRDK